MTWQFTLSGFLIGVLVGLTGMGGGSLLTPDPGDLLRLQADARGRHRRLHGAIFKSFGASGTGRLGHRCMRG
jgi:hypothetical protein